MSQNPCSHLPFVLPRHVDVHEAAGLRVILVEQVNQTVYKLDNAIGTLISLMVYSIRSSPIYACVFIIKILPCDIHVSADN